MLNELTKIKEPTMCDDNWIFVMHIDDIEKLDQEVATGRDICAISRSLGIYILFGYAVLLTETECHAGCLIFREYKPLEGNA